MAHRYYICPVVVDPRDAQNRVGYCFEQASLALNKHNPHLRVFFAMGE